MLAALYMHLKLVVDIAEGGLIGEPSGISALGDALGYYRTLAAARVTPAELGLERVQTRADHRGTLPAPFGAVRIPAILQATSAEQQRIFRTIRAPGNSECCWTCVER